MSDSLADKLREKSKRDDAFIVGSEIRAALQEQRQEIERLTAENERLRADAHKQFTAKNEAQDEVMRLRAELEKRDD